MRSPITQTGHPVAMEVEKLPQRKEKMRPKGKGPAMSQVQMQLQEQEQEQAEKPLLTIHHQEIPLRPRSLHHLKKLREMEQTLNKCRHRMSRHTMRNSLPCSLLQSPHLLCCRGIKQLNLHGSGLPNTP